MMRMIWTQDTKTRENSPVRHKSELNRKIGRKRERERVNDLGSEPAR